MKLSAVFFTLHIIWSSCEAIFRKSKSFNNKDFNNFKILENPKADYSARSLADCSIVCLETKSCLSCAYNSKTRACLLWDKDFIGISTQSKRSEDGWRYYYVVKDCTITENECLVNSGFTYEPETCMCLKITSTPYLYDDAVSVCKTMGASLAKIDRGLKQHKLEELLDNYMDQPFRIEGILDNVTKIWTYSDGSEITYFNWHQTQPSSTSTEIYINLQKQNGYRWYDSSWNKLRAPICQIKNQ